MGVGVRVVVEPVMDAVMDREFPRAVVVVRVPEDVGRADPVVRVGATVLRGVVVVSCSAGIVTDVVGYNW